MIKASMFTGRLSDVVFTQLSADIGGQSTLSTLIISRLKQAQNSNLSDFIGTRHRKLIHNYSIFLSANLSEFLTRISINEGIGLQTAIDWLLRAELPPNCSSEPIYGDELPPNCELGGNFDVDIPLEVGFLRPKIIKNQRYWYWRYYTKQGKRADIYMGTDRDRALSNARHIGIPADANSKHKRRKINAR